MCKIYDITDTASYKNDRWVSLPLQLFSVIPHRFLPGIKSPCWYEEFSSKPGNDLYRKNLFTLRSKSFKTVCDRLRANFHKHLYHKDGKDFRLRCLPYFYIIGQPKCGTTDLFHRMLLHPEVKFNIMKEPHWWTRKRFGKSSGNGCHFGLVFVNLTSLSNTLIDHYDRYFNVDKARADGTKSTGLKWLRSEASVRVYVKNWPGNKMSTKCQIIPMGG